MPLLPLSLVRSIWKARPSARGIVGQPELTSPRDSSTLTPTVLRWHIYSGIRINGGISVAEPIGQTTEPTVLSSVWRYRWLVLLLAIAFAGLGWLYGSQTASWTATATVAVQDPRSSNLFDQAFPDSPER
jgi:hypothetical protein